MAQQFHLYACILRIHWFEPEFFRADDLDLDIEISLEWDNPLALFTFFIQPTNLTLYDMMDSFGFGVSKRIVW